MSRLTRIRSAITGRFVDTNEANAAPDTTVMETYGDARIVELGSQVRELRVAAEAVILSEGYAQAEGRTEVNQADLDRLKAAVGFEEGQP